MFFSLTSCRLRKITSLCAEYCVLFSARLALERASATWDAVTGLEFRLLKAEEAFKGKPRQEGSRPSNKMQKLERQRDMVLGALEADSKR